MTAYAQPVHHPSGYHGEREQGICTPATILEPVYTLCDGPVDLDPFDDPASIVAAHHKIRWPRRCGFETTWHGKVFANPPFARLGEAMLKCLRSVGRDCEEVVLLCPFRSHRRYWWPFWSAQRVCYLGPVTFLGWEHGFSFPCVLVYFGPNGDKFERCVRHLGLVRGLTPWGASPMMPPMDISAEYEARAKSVLIDTVRAHPELSFDEIVEKLELEDGDVARLRSMPLSDLVVPAEVAQAAIEAASAPAKSVNGVKARNGAKGRNGVSEVRKKTPPRAKPAAAPRKARAAKGSATERVAEFVKSVRKGSKFSTKSVMKDTGLTRKSVLRSIAKMDNVEQHGAGRSAYLAKV